MSSSRQLDALEHLKQEPDARPDSTGSMLHELLRSLLEQRGEIQILDARVSMARRLNGEAIFGFDREDKSTYTSSLYSLESILVSEFGADRLLALLIALDAL